MEQKGRRGATLTCITVAILASSIVDLRADAAGQQDMVSVRYPFLVSGALTHARVVSLPDGVIACSGEIRIGEAELRQARNEAPYFARRGLKRDPIPLLEQQLAERLLLALARETVQEENEVPPADEDEMMRRYIGRVVGDVTPTEADLHAFYEQNREACGGLPFAQVKDYVARIVSERRQRERREEFVRDLGLRRPIEVSSSWLKVHAKNALNNPVDRLRGKGKPALAVFSAASCCGPDKMKPVLEEVQEAVGKTVHIVYVEAQSNQALGIRHRVSGIPTSIVFDARGREVVRHQGFVDKAAILGWLGLGDVPAQDHP